MDGEIFLKIVIKLGGSIFSKDEGVDLSYVKKFSAMIQGLLKGDQIFIVVGGGKTARRYIDAGRELGARESYLDTLGIYATRLNAMIISSSFGEKALDFIPEKIDDVNPDERRIVVMGGTAPGHSTDAVSAMLAAHVGADLLVRATNVDGVYDRDPKKYGDAKRFDRLSTRELIEITTTKDYQAGGHGALDAKAAKIIHENKIRVIVLDGRNIDNIRDAIGGEILGTIIEK